ncbi:MAG: hypothetical protein KGH71_06180, partial [Candidatus Micrarchaeota archaeon]|nr:hypothetical protein [Candidatus Micrarchaeota archaeon]
MRCNQKVQAAMEYLMTYGWAILVIAFVLGAIFQLGLFGTSTSSLGSSCLASTGFLCQNPTLNTSGYLAVKFGQIISNPITVTALGCSNNNTLPTSTTSVNLQVASGQSVGLSFPCTLAANSIGSAFKGYLWLTYSTASQSGIVDKMAVVTTKVSTTGNSLAVA